MDEKLSESSQTAPGRATSLPQSSGMSGSSVVNLQQIRLPAGVQKSTLFGIAETAKAAATAVDSRVGGGLAL